MAKSGFEPGDGAIVAQDGFYKGQEVEIVEALETPEGKSYVVKPPVGYYAMVVEQSGGVFGYPWHGDSTRMTFSEDELSHKNAGGVSSLKNEALRVAGHPSEFGGGS